MTQCLQDKEHKCYKEATRLQMKISFEANNFMPRISFITTPAILNFL